MFWWYAGLSNPLLVRNVAQSYTSVFFDTALLRCQHEGVKGLGRTDATGLWKSKPIAVSESWGMALCIQTCFNHDDTLWQRQGLVHNEGQGLDTLWHLLTATRGTDRLYPCMCMHSSTCNAALGQRGGNSANAAFWWPIGWPVMGHVDIPSLSNKATWLTDELLPDSGKEGGVEHTLFYSKLVHEGYLDSCSSVV